MWIALKRLKTVVQILSLFIFLGCAIYLGKYLYDGYTAQKDISVLQDIVADKSRRSNKATENHKERYAENGMLYDYYDLYKHNNDMVGWIKIEDTNINYPVMYHNTDNEYYIHKNFDKEYQYSGLPFMDKDCDLSKPSDNIIIYSHNMKNGTMFAQLLKYEDVNFLNEHKLIHFDTMYKRGTYDIIAVFRTQVGGVNEFKYYNFTNSHTDSDFENYVDAAKKLSMHSIDETAHYGDELLTLSTCSYNRKNERFVVVAKKVSK